MPTVSSSPPRAPPIKYTAPLGTRWAKEMAAAGGAGAFDLPTDPRSIGPWILGECVGKGASGRVKIAKHRLTGQLAAVKILPIAALHSSRASLATQQAKSDKQRLGIDREITMMKLMNHPNIMRIYDVYEGDKELFLVLEYVEGGELFDLLVNRGRLPPDEALAYFKQIIYGLNYAHTFSIIHRDLKPENILIASLAPPLIKIADWGMAAFAPPSLQLETSCGSPHYASPEIVNGQTYRGNATDIWSCGVILYALLTGRLPFDDKNVRTLLGKVKSGKFDMPAWIDPLAKDLLGRMLVVDVEKRITMPDILAHPWLHSPPSSPVSAEQEAAELATIQLPPSPSTLARPIPSPSLIDPELFASLRVIWGRHTDANGDSIKRDLCSPPGQGVHAKAFYFLLARYREESLRNNFQESQLDDQLDANAEVRNKQHSLGWELNPSTVNKKYDGIRSSMLSTEAPAPSRARSATSISISDLSAPVVRRAGTAADCSSSRERASSPAGPRAPTQGPARINMDLWRAQAHVLDDRRLKSTVNSPKASMSSGIGRGGPRPLPSLRGYTYSRTSPESHVSSVQFPPHLQRQDVVDRHRPRPAGPAPDARRSSMFVLSPNPSSAQPELPLAAVSTTSSTPAPMIYAPVPVSPVPPAVEIDKLVEMFDAEQKTAKASSEMEVDDISFPSRAPDPIAQSGQEGLSMSWDPAVGHGHRVASQPREHGDKENQSVREEGWSFIASGEPKTRGLGLGVAGGMSRAMGNVTNVREGSSGQVVKGTKEKDKKFRPPTLDFRNLNQQRRSTVLGSPMSITSPILSPTSTGRLMTSPVVGEFKGWFSNLFSWKNHATTQSGILYSADDVFRTRADVGRILEGMGVVVEGGGFDRGMGPIDCTAPLKCRVDDPSGTRTAFSLKPMRFRIEFLVAPTQDTNAFIAIPGQTHSYNLDLLKAPAPGHQSMHFAGSAGVTGSTAIPRSRNGILMNGKSHTTPTMSSPSPDCEFPPGSVCAIFMAYEKGSVSSFRVIWRRLKDAYGAGSAASAYPTFSPAMAGTPMAEYPESYFHSTMAT
ncbi:putative serine/Threonine protein kinases, catalytic domain [Lyophyllum shimeji]|uniref:Serine/Threonine protein kinases, catalytic domain n=1 Tax=Lyophyllum shimeji TaxID=47721 RepID=A0A9P3PVY6_LYOSH|nr:putative serine/Threonine protein kinases, catalytic domain [Lyophyllum shimeji]